MSRFKREYKLQQQTPMIHFQHKEPGATLRASEVKPKLDGFLVSWCKEQGLTIPDNWYVEPTKKDALSYKMQFNVSDIPVRSLPDSKLFLGNMGVDNENEKIRAIEYRSSITMKLVCFTEKTIDLSGIHGVACPDSNWAASLFDLLELALPHFFTATAFGMRSGKGFGCFSLRENDIGARFKCGFDLFVPNYYTITYPANSTLKLDHVWIINGMMKSGFNFTFASSLNYYKGRIFRYFSTEKPAPIGSDKAYIKQKVLLPNNQDADLRSEEKQPYGTFRFSRAMLGLPAFDVGYQFRASQKSRRKGTVKISHQDIKRFGSPVNYRIHNNILYIIPADIPEQLFDSEFSLNGKKLKTPNTDEFNLIKFLDWFAEQFNSRTEISAWKKSEQRPGKDEPLWNMIIGFCNTPADKHPRIVKHERRSEVV